MPATLGSAPNADDDDKNKDVVAAGTATALSEQPATPQLEKRGREIRRRKSGDSAAGLYDPPEPASQPGAGSEPGYLVPSQVPEDDNLPHDKEADDAVPQEHSDARNTLGNEIQETPPTLLVAELARDDMDIEHRLAERLEAEIAERLSLEVNRRFEQERQNHAIAVVVSSQEGKDTIGDIEQSKLQGAPMGAADDDKQFTICGIHRTYFWAIILCFIALVIVGGIVGFVMSRNSSTNEGNSNSSESLDSVSLSPSALDTGSLSPSAVPTMVNRRWDYLLGVIGDLTLPADAVEDGQTPAEYFADTTTPQYLALQWMAEQDMEFDIFSKDRLIVLERYVATLMYFSTNGPTRWVDSLNFVTSSLSVCDWQNATSGRGISCNQDSFIDVLDIDSNNLQGPLLWELSLISSLFKINLSYNDMYGSLPIEWSSLTGLRVLWLEDNGIAGTLPQGYWSALLNLEYLHLDHNEFSGTLPTEIGNLTKLNTLRVNRNLLSGQQPSEYSRLTNLQTYDVSGNKLRGTIPTQYGLLNNLEYLYFNENEFTGTLPTEIGNLTKLHNFFVQFNLLSGQVPSEYSRLTNLQGNDVSWNNLTGTISTEFGLLTNQVSLYFNENEFYGTLPTEFGNMTKLQIFVVYKNHLSGQMPSEYSRLTDLQLYDVSWNQLNGTIPTEYGLLTSLESLYLDNNVFNGTLPTELGNLTKLITLRVYTNPLSGQVPSEYSRLASLEHVLFQETGLTGSSVNDAFCFIPSIQTLKGDCLPNYGTGLPAQINCTCCTSCCNDTLCT
jgi:Leucine-rich repeat (LRR) protein